MSIRIDEMMPISFPKDTYQYGQRTDGETHGVVLTKPHIVELILDLAGYKVDKTLISKRLLEPSCGQGAFLVPAVHRLMRSLTLANGSLSDVKDAILSFDIDSKHVETTKSNLIGVITSYGHKKSAAKKIVDSWIHRGDFLLTELRPMFDYVVGNPPYIRIEQIALQLQSEYRRRYASLYDRADLYVAFIERSLSLLSQTGVLSFICADRWILNKYGAPLRKKIADGFKVHSYIDLHQISPFDSEVIAYPSIFLVSRGVTDQVNVLTLKNGTEDECKSVRRAISNKGTTDTNISYALYDKWFEGEAPWTLSSPDQLRVLRNLEERFKPIEEDETIEVRIGVATGCDKVYIVSKDAPIEKSRLLPLVMRDDLDKGKIKRAGRYVINTFEDGEGIIDLVKYPKLQSYLKKHSEQLKKRHVAKKNERRWFRTIDRVYPELAKKPKLLIPDIAGSNEVTFDPGRYYPHHNLYFIISDSWDLEVLGGLLSSRVALFFVWSYAVKMRGGYLRFQAQYLRRIRLPSPDSLSSKQRMKIKTAFRNRDFKRLDDLALKAYGLSELPDFNFLDTRH